MSKSKKRFRKNLSSSTSSSILNKKRFRFQGGSFSSVSSEKLISADNIVSTHGNSQSSLPTPYSDQTSANFEELSGNILQQKSNVNVSMSAGHSSVECPSKLTWCPKEHAIFDTFGPPRTGDTFSGDTDSLLPGVDTDSSWYDRCNECWEPSSSVESEIAFNNNSRDSVTPEAVADGSVSDVTARSSDQLSSSFQASISIANLGDEVAETKDGHRGVAVGYKCPACGEIVAAVSERIFPNHPNLNHWKHCAKLRNVPSVSDLRFQCSLLNNSQGEGPIFSLANTVTDEQAQEHAMMVELARYDTINARYRPFDRGKKDK